MSERTVRRRIAAAVAGCVVASLVSVSNAVPASASGQRFIDPIFGSVSNTTGVAFATAPALVTGTPQTLRLDWYQPNGDPLAERPMVVFIHGGGFGFGGRGNLTAMAVEYARRGYVTASIDYRLDPGNRCQDVQDELIPDPTELAIERARCEQAIIAAQHDGQAAVRWVRANATTLRVDPDRVAVIGDSAGAITALHMAYRSDDPGTVGTNLGQDSHIQAAIAMSGCNYLPDSIGPGDAPAFYLHGELDSLVPFTCAQQNAAAAVSAGLVAETMFFFGTGSHAGALYAEHKAAADARFTAFLIAQLRLDHRAQAGSKTVIHGLANRSAVISIVMTGNAGPGFLQVLPCAANPGGFSNMNVDAAGETRAGLAVVRFDASGDVCIFSEPTTHLVVDLQGYFAVGAIDDVADARLFDSRPDHAPVVPSRSVTTLTGRPSSTAVVSLVVVENQSAGFLQVLDCGTAPGASANLNADRPNEIIANLAFVHFDSSGHACLFNEMATHLVVDLQAYLADGAFDDIVDDRVLDTRDFQPAPASTQTQITGRADSTAVVSLTATQAVNEGFLQVLPCGAAPGGASNLNVDRPGQTIGNLAFVRFDATSRACVFTQTGTHLVGDIQGYLAPAAFDDVPDVRLLDTRLTV